MFVNKTTSAGNSQGYLLIYNIIKNNSGAIHFELLYTKPLISEVSSINYYENPNMLCVGLNNGNVIIYKIFINEGSQECRDLVEEACVLKSHKKKIVGVCMNHTIGYIYTVARDNNLIISEINYQSLMKNMPISKKEISTMIYDEHWGRMFLTDDSGSIWILDISSNPVR